MRGTPPKKQGLVTMFVEMFDSRSSSYILPETPRRFGNPSFPSTSKNLATSVTLKMIKFYANLGGGLVCG